MSSITRFLSLRPRPRHSIGSHNPPRSQPTPRPPHSKRAPICSRILPKAVSMLNLPNCHPDLALPPTGAQARRSSRLWHCAFHRQGFHLRVAGEFLNATSDAEHEAAVLRSTRMRSCKPYKLAGGASVEDPSSARKHRSPPLLFDSVPSVRKIIYIVILFLPLILSISSDSLPRCTSPLLSWWLLPRSV